MSIQNKILHKLPILSEVDVLITGTIFPLGPETDARKVLELLSGRFDKGG